MTNMTLEEAFTSCSEGGNFVTHKNLDSKQSMHYYKGDFYYEDGAVIAECNGALPWLENQEWAKDGWYIKYEKKNIDLAKLDKMHTYSGHKMLYGISYEDCCRKDKEE